MKSHLAWLATMLLSTVAVVDTGCTTRCTSSPFCRWFDLATFCNDSGTCSIPPGMGISPSTLDADKDPWGQGTFNELWPRSTIAVPLSDLGDVVAQKPVLAVVLRAGAPLSADAIAITFDGKAAACLLVQGGNGENLVALTCDVPVAAKELGFAYVLMGTKGSPGNAAFDVQLFLHEPQGRCTGAAEMCPL